ncbi:MAG: MoxR family ATPase [Nannocystaceae bacterium]
MTTTPRFIDVERWADQTETLPELPGLPATPHRFERRSLHAINAALAAGRPLLVRGEPGTGKSQLARAAAFLLGRSYVWRVMDVQTKVSDLFYEFDAIERLAQAQIAALLCREADDPAQVIADYLDERRFIRPGVLWKAFDAAGAEAWPEDPEPSERDAAEGLPPVVLIDEIDKTDPSVPNGLLEALGQGTFPVRQVEDVSLHRKGRAAPLIIITTNDERELPAAFVRRCLVYSIRLSKTQPGLEEWLVKRGRTHFPKLSDSTLLSKAATLLWHDRTEALRQQLPLPGQAEYLDLLRAVTTLGEDDPAEELDETAMLELLDELADFALKKHPDQYPDEEPGGRG